MKTTTLVLILFLTSLDLWAQIPGGPGPGGPGGPGGMPPAARRFPRRMPGAPGGPGGPGGAPAATPPSAQPPGMSGLPSTSPILGPNADSSAGNNPAGDQMVQAGQINFEGVDVSQVLDVYAKLVGRTLLRAQLPQASIVLKTETPLTKAEAIQALQAVLSMNGITVVNMGDKFVKVVAKTEANTVGAPFSEVPADQLPELGPYVTRIVQLHFLKPSIVMPLITPFANLPTAVLAIDDNGILVLRDNAENVKRMLEMISKVDVSVPAEYISEVIPIRYAQASDIASALNSLGSGGGGSVSIGNNSATRGGNGMRSGGGMGGMGGINGVGGGGSGFGGGGAYGGSAYGQQNNGAYGQQGTTANGTPTGGTSFQSRLNSIIQNAGGGAGGAGGGRQEPIQVFGQTKIIADQRSNSLLIFATRTDMANIKHVISQLDVLLAQVLIEAVIMDVNLGNTFSFGTSIAQNQKTVGSVGSGITNAIVTAGGGNNGASFLNSLTNTSSFGNNLGSGFSYFANIGPTWDVAVNALASDNNATVIQRPRIQTSQAKPATFFVGNTVPYVTGTYYGGGYSGGNSSQYSQLSVGVELDVTPFINPDGLVVMDINQEIDDVNGYTSIDGNQVPNTDKRTLSSEIAVRNLDTIMLGGFIRSDKSTSRSGVPVLEDIPILGALFSNRNSSKSREELVVLMRPTVMNTPAEAAAQTLREERRLPGVSAAAADDAVYERKLIDAERKAELKRAKEKGETNGFFNGESETILQTDRVGLGNTAATNAPAPVYMIHPIIQPQDNDSTTTPATPPPGQ